MIYIVHCAEVIVFREVYIVQVISFLFCSVQVTEVNSKELSLFSGIHYAPLTFPSFTTYWAWIIWPADWLLIVCCSDSWARWTKTTFAIRAFFYCRNCKKAFQFGIKLPDQKGCMGGYFWGLLLHSWYSPWWLSRFAPHSFIVSNYFCLVILILTFSLHFLSSWHNVKDIIEKNGLSVVQWWNLPLTSWSRSLLGLPHLGDAYCVAASWPSSFVFPFLWVGRVVWCTYREEYAAAHSLSRMVLFLLVKKKKKRDIHFGELWA